MNYSPHYTAVLFYFLRHRDGLNPIQALAAVHDSADPNAVLLDPYRPELEGFSFPVLAYAAQSALAPLKTTQQRLDLLHALIDRGARRAEATAFLLAVYSDLWQSHPATARRMVIGLHTLHQAFEPYVQGARPLPGQPAPAQPLAKPLTPTPDEIPF